MLTSVGRLAIEIAKFHEYARPSRTEVLARRHIVEQVREHVREILPNYFLEVFGSERTGLALATSDIDLRLLKRDDVESHGRLPPGKQERKVLVNKLHKLFKKFKSRGDYLMPTVRHARYPLISMQDRRSGLDIQIVLSNDTALSREFVHSYLHQYPILHPLYSVIKTIFDSRGLSDVFRGGFGSYSIFMMIVASLRHAPSKQSTAEEALIHFLRFWGHFDTSSQGVSIEPPEFFDKYKHPVVPEKVKVQILVLQPLLVYVLVLWY